VFWWPAQLREMQRTLRWKTWPMFRGKLSSYRPVLQPNLVVAQGQLLNLNFGSSLVQAAMIILMFVALYIWWRWIAKMEAAEAEKYQVQFLALQIHHTQSTAPRAR